jgi:nucleoid DNA-binding protein
MKKLEIARRMARQSGITRAEAADRLDEVVSEILSSLRKGEPAPLPGLGRFVPAADGKIGFEPEGCDRHE